MRPDAARISVCPAWPGSRGARKESSETVTDYLQLMFDLALRKQPQGIHFWLTVYVVFVLFGTLVHALRVRRWPGTAGRLLRLGIRQFGATELHPANQQFVPDALYEYQVHGQVYQGREISIWKMSASGVLKGTAGLLPRRVKPDASGTVRVYYHPGKPQRSLLLRPGWMSLWSLCAAIAMVIACYVGRW